MVIDQSKKQNGKALIYYEKKEKRFINFTMWRFLMMTEGGGGDKSVSK